MTKIIITVILLAAISLSCGHDPAPLNVVFIGLDTVRSDHLGCYGYGRNTSPAIDRLASDGTLFEYALSHSPWTLPSFASAFTSLYPTQHGAGFLESSMGRRFPTLATVLADNGYATGAIVNTAALNPVFGIDRGFAHYDVTPITAGRVADGTTRAALEWIDARGEDPFFVFVHYYDPHLPFTPPAPYDNMFDPEYAGPLGKSFDPEFLINDRADGFTRMNAFPDRDKEHIVALYDGEIAFADKAIGDLLDGLDSRGLGENSIVVFMSDHGEEFFDHGGFAHGHTLYEELLRVPLILRLPGRIPAGARVPGIVRLIDIMPTLLSLLGIEIDAGLEGRDLGPLLGGGAVAAPARDGALLTQEAFSEALLYGPEQKSITAYPYKLIMNMASREEMLFDLDRDAAETQNLVAPEAAAAVPSEYHSLGERLYGTMLRASDTWYVQVEPGGAGHMLELSVTVGGAHGQGEITLHKVFGSSGRFLEDSQIGLSRETPSHMKLVGFSLDDSFILAFKVEPVRTLVEFDFIIDGKPATATTYIGAEMAHPDEMPFEIRGGRIGKEARGKPASHPGAPCFMVWHAGQDSQGRRPAKLDNDVKQELRSLGYIQ